MTSVAAANVQLMLAKLREDPVQVVRTIALSITDVVDTDPLRGVAMVFIVAFVLSFMLRALSGIARILAFSLNATFFAIIAIGMVRIAHVYPDFLESWGPKAWLFPGA